MEQDKVKETLEIAVKHSFKKFHEAFLQDIDSGDFTITKKGYCLKVNNDEEYQIVYSVEKKELKDD